MECFSCFKKKKFKGKKKNEPITRDSPPPPRHVPVSVGQKAEAKAEAVAVVDDDDNDNNGAKAYNFRELATATKNFKHECLLGEGDIGRVYRGVLQSTGQIMAIRQLDRTGTQGSKDFQAEILKLSQLHHPNLVQIIGYCADGDQRLLVYEYFPSGSLEIHLFGNTPNPNFTHKSLCPQFSIIYSSCHDLDF